MWVPRLFLWRRSLPDCTLTCLPSCVGAANPAKYPPAVYRDLVLEFYRANYFHQPGGTPKEAADGSGAATSMSAAE